MTIADELWRAANQDLWTGHSRLHGWVSCGSALNYDHAIPFLESLGWDEESFYQFENGRQRQGARYLWLDFARLVAEDESL